jgi:uncharacterized protein (DUF736 family)
MSYQEKDMQGNLWSGNDSVVVGKGKIPINGEDHYCALVASENRDGTKMYELMVSAGRVYFNEPETKKNPAGPDFGSTKISINGVKFKFAGWSNTSQNGSDYVNAKLTPNEEDVPF